MRHGLVLLLQICSCGARLERGGTGRATEYDPASPTPLSLSDVDGSFSPSADLSGPCVTLTRSAASAALASGTTASKKAWLWPKEQTGIYEARRGSDHSRGIGVAGPDDRAERQAFIQKEYRVQA